MGHLIPVLRRAKDPTHPAHTIGHMQRRCKSAAGGRAPRRPGNRARAPCGRPTLPMGITVPCKGLQRLCPRCPCAAAHYQCWRGAQEGGKRPGPGRTAPHPRGNGGPAPSHPTLQHPHPDHETYRASRHAIGVWIAHHSRPTAPGRLFVAKRRRGGTILTNATVNLFNFLEIFIFLIASKIPE